MKLKLNLENCYGIGKLQKEFDFSDKNVLLFYAQMVFLKLLLQKHLKILKMVNKLKTKYFQKEYQKPILNLMVKKLIKKIFLFLILMIENLILLRV